MAHDAGPIEAPTPPGRPVPGIVVRAAELAFPPALCKHRYAGLQYATLPDGYATGNTQTLERDIIFGICPGESF